MKLYLMSDDITLRSRWISIFSSMKPSTFSVFSTDVEHSSILFVSDSLLKSKTEEEWQKLFKNHVMVLSLDPNYDDAQRFLQAGAMGYGNAMMHESHLHSAFKALEEGKVWLHPDFIKLLISQVQNTQETNTKEHTVLKVLSKREQEVAVMLGEGASHQEIAEELEITVRTVKAHATSIYHKLNVKDRLALSILLHS